MGVVLYLTSHIEFSAQLRDGVSRPGIGFGLQCITMASCICGRQASSLGEGQHTNAAYIVDILSVLGCALCFHALDPWP